MKAGEWTAQKNRNGEQLPKKAHKWRALPGPHGEAIQKKLGAVAFQKKVLQKKPEEGELGKNKAKKGFENTPARSAPKNQNVNHSEKGTEQRAPKKPQKAPKKRKDAKKTPNIQKMSGGVAFQKTAKL